MNSHQAQPTAPPQGQISIQDVFSMYIALTGITTPPTETRTQAINNLEALILNFTQSLGIPGAKN